MNRILFFAGIAIVLVPLIFYFFIFHYGLSSDPTAWGNFGSYLGGIFGSLSFIIVAYSLLLAKTQFEKQSQDNIFYSLIENQQKRIINSSIETVKGEIKSYQILQFIVAELNKEMAKQAVSFGRQLLCETPDEIASLYFQKIFQANGLPFSSFEELELKLRAQLRERVFNDRWELIKDYLGSVGSESKEQLEALRALGSVYFYKVNFEKRADIYRIVFQIINDKYGSFFDGYTKGNRFLCSFIDTAIRQDSYIQQFSSQLTKYEVVLIFYHLASGYADNDLYRFTKRNNIFSDVYSYNGLLIDAPSKEEMEREIAQIYTLYE